jgi:hypothetical protein
LGHVGRSIVLRRAAGGVVKIERSRRDGRITVVERSGDDRPDGDDRC